MQKSFNRRSRCCITVQTAYRFTHGGSVLGKGKYVGAILLRKTPQNLAVKLYRVGAIYAEDI